MEIVSKVPEVTPELIEKNAEFQKAWAKEFSIPETSQKTYAETVVRNNLNILDSLYQKCADAKDYKTTTDIAGRIARLSNDTATWAESIGWFDLARKLTWRERDKERLTAMLEAQTRDDNEWCEHPIFEFIDGNPSQIAAREFDFYSNHHGKIVSMVKCSKCGFRNAKDLPAELQKLSQHRAAVVKAGVDKPVDLNEVLK